VLIIMHVHATEQYHYIYRDDALLARLQTAVSFESI